jgi:hypothetical protein
LDVDAVILKYSGEFSEESPCGYVFTLPDGKIVRINQTMLNWVGKCAEDVLYTNKFQDLLTKKWKVFYELNHLPLLQLQGFIYEVRYELHHQQHPIPVLASIIQLKDSNDELLLNRVVIFKV